MSYVEMNSGASWGGISVATIATTTGSKVLASVSHEDYDLYLLELIVNNNTIIASTLFSYYDVLALRGSVDGQAGIQVRDYQNGELALSSLIWRTSTSTNNVSIDMTPPSGATNYSAALRGIKLS